MKRNVPQVLGKHLDNALILDAWIQWASNPTSSSAGYGLEENYSFIRSNLMERYLISAEYAEQHIQKLKNEASSLTAIGYEIYDLRKGILEEARSSGIWTKIMKEKLEQSSSDAKKAVYLLLYLKSQGYFRSNPDSDCESHSFEMDSWVQFLTYFRTFYLAAYGGAFSKSIDTELFKVGLWNKLWYKPSRSPGKIEVIMVPLPTLEELNFNEADMTQKADVKQQLIEQLFRDCRFEQLTFIDEVTKAPFGLRRFKQEVPSVEGIVAISGKDGYEVAISPFLLEQARDVLNSHKQEMIHDFGEKIEKALAQLCEEKWPECERTCKAKGQQSLWRIDSASYSPLYVYLTPWLTEADVNTLFSDKDLNAIFIILTQSIPAIKRTLFNKIATFRYLEVLLPSGDSYQCWKAAGERFGHASRIIELIQKSIVKTSNIQNSVRSPDSKNLSVEKLESEKLLPVLLSRDEGQLLEFKSNLRYDVKASEHGVDKTNPKLEREILKEVCAFLNSDGGTLLIGVSDDKKILGLSNDYRYLPMKKDKDGFEVYLRNKLNQNLKPEIPGLVKISFETREGLDVCFVQIERSNKEIFLKGLEGKDIQEFWIREGNSIRQLIGAAMIEYIRKHWSK